VIGIYIHPESMTIEQYRSADEELRSLGVSEEGMPAPHLFAEGENLPVFDARETKEAFDAFGKQLTPILQEVGIVMAPLMFCRK
jgi:hypothetical protein